MIETVPADDGSVPETTGAVDDPEIPVNTMFDPATPEGEVEQAVLADQALYEICLRDLPACDVEQATRLTILDVMEGRARRIGAAKSSGQVVENVESIDVQITEIRFPGLPVEAEVEVCIVDDSRFVVPATDEVPEQVVVEGFISLRREYLVTQIGDQWFLTATETIETGLGAENNLCE